MVNSLHFETFDDLLHYVGALNLDARILREPPHDVIVSNQCLLPDLFGFCINSSPCCYLDITLVPDSHFLCISQHQILQYYLGALESHEIPLVEESSLNITMPTGYVPLGSVIKRLTFEPSVLPLEIITSLMAKRQYSDLSFLPDALPARILNVGGDPKIRYDN